MTTTQECSRKKAAWDVFKKQLVIDTEDNKEQWNELILHNSTENLERAAKTLTKSIKKAADTHAPPHNITPKSNP